MMLSLGESKRDTRDVVAMARRPWQPTHHLHHRHHPHCTLLVPPMPWEESLGEVALVGERLGLVLSDELATIVFPLLIWAFLNEMSHVAVVVASPYTLLAPCATRVVFAKVGPRVFLAPKLP